MRIKKTLAALSLATMATAVPAIAHHSAAAYDHAKKLTLTGTVKEFHWANPHTWITVTVPTKSGGTQEWKLEGGSVSILIRNGWKKTTIRPGDKVKLLISPRRDGEPGGEFYTVLTRNGEKVEVLNNADPQG